MSISKTAASIGQSVTLKLNAEAARRRAEDEPVIHLGGGEPKSKAPSEAVAAAAELLNTGEVRYTPADGTPSLKNAIIRYTEQYYNRVVAPENVMASAGAKQAIMVALQAVVAPGDQVLYPTPYWVSYPEMAKLCGAEQVAAPIQDGSFYPRLADIEAKFTRRTKAIIINSPNNPSGAVYSEEFIADVIGFCERRGIYLIMDDIYQRLVFDGRRPPNCWQYAKDRSESSKLIIINGVSKQYAMTGFRLGWAIANRQLIEVMTNIQSHQTSGPPALGQVAAAAALNGNQASVEALRSGLEGKRDLLMQQIKSVDGVKATKPDGTFYCFADFRAHNKNSTKLAEFLLNTALVVTVPGVEFGMDGFLRISFCGSKEDIINGIERIKWALDPDSPNELHVGNRVLVRQRLRETPKPQRVESLD